MSPALDIVCCGMIEYGMEHLGGLVGSMVRYMDDVCWHISVSDIYAVSDDAEEKQVSEYFGRVVVSYLPPLPLVLNVEPVSDSHRLLELMANTAVVYGTLWFKP